MYVARLWLAARSDCGNTFPTVPQMALASSASVFLTNRNSARPRVSIAQPKLAKKQEQFCVQKLTPFYLAIDPGFARRPSTKKQAVAIRQRHTRLIQSAGNVTSAPPAYLNLPPPTTFFPLSTHTQLHTRIHHLHQAHRDLQLSIKTSINFSILNKHYHH
jgi:hypothetical protein